MADFTHILEDEDLRRLREKFDSSALVRANVDALEGAYAPLKAWGEATGHVFYGTEPLSPRERELCLVVLLSINAPEVSLAFHVYWALMEGVSPPELCQALGLAGCYAGMPVLVRGLTTVGKTLPILKRMASAEKRGAADVFAVLMRELSSIPEPAAR